MIKWEPTGYGGECFYGPDCSMGVEHNGCWYVRCNHKSKFNSKRTDVDSAKRAAESTLAEMIREEIIERNKILEMLA